MPITIQPSGHRAVNLTRNGKPLLAGDIKTGEVLSISLSGDGTYAMEKAGNRRQRRAARRKRNNDHQD